MQQPFKYCIICQKTGEIQETNIEPSLHHLQTWEPTDNPKVKELKQTKICYIDTRYEAKLRLFNYIQYTKKGLKIPSYNPFLGTEIGKSTPILNF